jgi:hypothetical protein
VLKKVFLVYILLAMYLGNAFGMESPTKRRKLGFGTGLDFVVSEMHRLFQEGVPGGEVSSEPLGTFSNDEILSYRSGRGKSLLWIAFIFRQSCIMHAVVQRVFRTKNFDYIFQDKELLFYLLENGGKVWTVWLFRAFIALRPYTEDDGFALEDMTIYLEEIVKDEKKIELALSLKEKAKKLLEDRELADCFLNL